MPHNLYLHSALVKSRKIDRTKKEEVKDANRYVFIEAIIALGVSLVINIMVTAVFAHGLFDKTNNQIRAMCDNTSAILNPNTFPADDKYVDADLRKAVSIITSLPVVIAQLFNRESFWAVPSDFRRSTSGPSASSRLVKVRP